MNQRVLYIVNGVLAIGLVLVTVISLSGRGYSLAAPAAAQTQPPTPAQGITVVGEGTVTAQPDEAVLQLGVQTNKSTAQEAMSENSRIMQAVIDAVKALDVPETDIRTGRVSLFPTMAPSRPGETRGPTVVGYQATNQVIVTLEPGKAGQVLDAAVSAGANTSSGVQFGFRDPARLQNQALQAAVANARAKADAIAAELGVRVEGVASVSEESTIVPRPFLPDAVAGRIEQAQPTPIQPGQQDITSRVTVIFAFR